MNRTLFLHEEIVLLTLSDEKGTALTEWLCTATAGAVLAELLLAGRIRIETVGKKHLVRVVGTERLGNEVVDHFLDRLAKEPKQRSLQSWIERLSRTKDLKGRVARPLVTDGLLEEVQDTILFVFPRTRYPEADGTPETEIVERLRHAIFTDASDVDARTVTLLSLAHATGLLKHHFPKAELKERKARIEALVSGELAGSEVGAAVSEMIETLHAVILVTCFLPIFTTVVT